MTAKNYMKFCNIQLIFLLIYHVSDGLLFDAGLFLSAPGAGLIPNNPPTGHLLFNSTKINITL